MTTEASRPLRIVGRYALYDEIASGGMATVHIGRLVAAAGFARTVAIKCLHPTVARDPEFATMFLDEARLAARIHHPNVIQTLDVVALDNELFLILEYVHGEAFSTFVSQARRVRGRVPVPIATHIIGEVLQGLHAAHEAKSERGEPLGIVHRDVSPQNIMVGADGVSRVFDFGIAKSLGRLQSTREGQVKGKLGYMAPEHFRGEPVTRRSDLYAAGIVLWEAITGQRLFGGASEAEVVYAALQGAVNAPSALAPGVPPALDAAILRALERDPEQRFATAKDMAIALEAACPPIAKQLVSDWVQTIAPPSLARRAEALQAIESAPADAMPDAAADDDPRRSQATVRPRGSLVSESGVLNSARSEAPGDVAPEDVAAFRPAPPWRRLAIAGGALLAVAAIVAFFWRGSGTSAESGAPSSTPAVAASVPSSSAAPALPEPASDAASTGAEPVAAPPPSAAEAAADASSPVGSSSAAPPGPAGSAARPAGSGAPKKRPRADELLGRD